MGRATYNCADATRPTLRRHNYTMSYRGVTCVPCRGAGANPRPGNGEKGDILRQGIPPRGRVRFYRYHQNSQSIRNPNPSKTPEIFRDVIAYRGLFRLIGGWRAKSAYRNQNDTYQRMRATGIVVVEYFPTAE